MISREFDPTDSTVITVGMFNAGTAVNVIPETATVSGTARTLHDAARKQVHAAMERRFTGIAEANRCELRFEWIEGYPPTVNDPAMSEYVAATAKATFGNDRYLPVARPSMGGEDFAYYLEKVPGCFFLIGVEPVDRETYPPLHSDRFDFTDASIAVGMRMFVELVKNFKAS